jgi:hypothetical protein
VDTGPAFGITEAIEAIAALPLDQIEEASGELHRRVGAALRRIGEEYADRSIGQDHSPRRQTAELAALIELASGTLSAVAAGGEPVTLRADRHPATTAALMYAAPAIPALLQRLEQDRRLLTSLARHLEARLDEEHATAWGRTRLRYLLVDAAVTQPARCAQILEQRALEIEAAELRRIQEEARRRAEGRAEE